MFLLQAWRRLKSIYPETVSELAALSVGRDGVSRRPIDWHQSRALIIAYTTTSNWILVHIAFWLSPYDVGNIKGHLEVQITSAVYAVMATLLAAILNLDDLRRIYGPGALAVRCTLWSALSCLILMVIAYGVFYASLGRWILFSIFCLGVLASYPFRALLTKLAASNRRRILVIGGQGAAVRFSRRLKQYVLPFDLIPLDLSSLDPAQSRAEGIEKVCRRMRISEVVLSFDTELPKPERNRLVEGCIFTGISVSTETAFVERHLQLTPVETVEMDWFEYLDLKMHHPLYHNVKRAIDLVLASMLLLVLGPIILLAMAWVRAVDGGPAILRQKRVGQYGKIFEMLKIRTMRRQSECTKATWTQVNDKRLLPLAGLFRRLRIDELPQLINILRGTMTLIGPRPEIPELNKDVEDDMPIFRFRYCVKPGLTGWAQINAPYGASLIDARRKLEFDLFYIKNMSLVLDLQILLRTVGSWMQGAR